MGPEDYETIAAIAMEDPERIGMMVSSTPTGARGMFYRICTELKFNKDEEVQPINTKNFGYIYNPKHYNRDNSTGWKEFYFPSTVNPNWSEKMEKELKAEYTEVAYEHEVLAMFGTEMEGVFNKDYLDEAASSKYNLIEERQREGPIAIGVDWDKYGATTNIVVVQYDPNDVRRARPEIGKIDNGFGRFKIINHIEIPKSDMQYDIAVQTIKRLDKKYDPFAIRVDRGAGEYQTEILRKSLGEKVQGVFYGEKIEIRDPLTNRIEKKSLKPFLVNQMVLLLERGQLRIPHIEVNEVIHRQMVNFRVTKVSATTQEPTYTDKDEHGLDGFIFAMTGFMDEYPHLIDIIDEAVFETSVGVTKQKKHNAMADIEKQLQEGLKVNKKESFEDEIKPRYEKVPLGFSKRRANNSINKLGWGTRGNAGGSIWRNGW